VVPVADDLDTFFSMAEKQRLIKQCLEGLRATDEDKNVPGYNKYSLYKGESIGAYTFLQPSFILAYDQGSITF
jgi:hypothetical protein